MGRPKKSFIEKLGLEEVDSLTPAICRDRSAKLKKKVKAGAFDDKPDLLKQAKYYANWYAWKAKNFRTLKIGGKKSGISAKADRKRNTKKKASLDEAMGITKRKPIVSRLKKAA